MFVFLTRVEAKPKADNVGVLSTNQKDERIVIEDDSPPRMPNPARHKTIPVGMKNVGSSCWYNTVAQGLVSQI